MSKRVILLSIAVLFTTAAVLLFYISRPKEVTPDAIEKVPNNVLIDAILDKYQENNIDYSSSSISIDDIDYYQDKWLVVHITLLGEPIESDGRVAVHILERGDSDTVKVIAYTSDGFSKNAFPEGTPDHVIERAKEL